MKQCEKYWLHCSEAFAVRPGHCLNEGVTNSYKKTASNEAVFYRSILIRYLSSSRGGVQIPPFFDGDILIPGVYGDPHRIYRS